MSWETIVTLITALLTSGGILYLIVEKLFSRKKDKAEVKSAEIQNGNDVADLYNKIDEIVERKTAPIKSELGEVKGQLDEIKSHWCCYREECAQRILYKTTKLKVQADGEEHAAEEDMLK